jgi:hypothetical protein
VAYGDYGRLEFLSLRGIDSSQEVLKAQASLSQYRTDRKDVAVSVDGGNQSEKALLFSRDGFIEVQKHTSCAECIKRSQDVEFTLAGIAGGAATKSNLQAVAIDNLFKCIRKLNKGGVIEKRERLQGSVAPVAPGAGTESIRCVKYV